MSTPMFHIPTGLVGEVSRIREQVRMQREQVVAAAAILAQDQAGWRRSSSQISNRLAAIRARLLKY